MSNQFELEVQRRVTDILASAGVARGVISQEVLFMLPPEFTREYTRLFYQVFKEDIANGNGGLSGDAGTPVRVGKGVARGEKGSMRATGGGKRFRVHWLLKDEAAFRVKKRLDRKLVRLGRGIERELRREDSENGGGEVRCRACGIELDGGWNWCPGCGTRKVQVHSEV